MSETARTFPAFDTFGAALEDAAKADPTLGFRFISEEGVPGFAPKAQSEASFSYTALERASARYGGALQALGLHGDPRALSQLLGRLLHDPVHGDAAVLDPALELGARRTVFHRRQRRGEEAIEACACAFPGNDEANGSQGRA
jgi:hypothetical protein